MANIEHIKINSTTYDIYDNSPTYITSNMVDSSNGSIYVYYCPGCKLYKIFFWYLTVLYNTTLGANWSRGKVGGSSTTWKVQNIVPSHTSSFTVTLPSHNVHSIMTLDSQGIAVNTTLYGQAAAGSSTGDWLTAGEISFARGGDLGSLGTSDERRIIGELLWLGI